MSEVVEFACQEDFCGAEVEIPWEPGQALFPLGSCEQCGSVYLIQKNTDNQWILDKNGVLEKVNPEQRTLKTVQSDTLGFSALFKNLSVFNKSGSRTSF